MSDFQLPPHALVTEADGLQILVLQRRGLPLFHARLSLPAGAAGDPRGKAGLAQFAVDLLRRGSAKRSADELDDLIEGMGASLFVDCSPDEAALALTVPSELAASALDALLEVALAPAFPDEEVLAARRRTLAALQSDLDEPASVAGRALVEAGFGRGHPYGHPTFGRMAEVETFSRDDVATFHAARCQPRGAMLVIVSADEPGRALDFARERLARWTWPAPRALDAPAMPASLAERPAQPPLSTLIVHKPDSTQAQLRILSTGRTRASPGYAEAILMNTALGGGFTSLLVDAIRVDRGLSYSVSSRLLSYRSAGLSLFSSFTKNETLRELVDVALDKMRGYAASGPAPEALEKCRVYLAGLFPLGIESHEALAEACADAILDGLGLQHIVTYRSRVLGATVEGVREAARALSPAKPGAQIVVVGDAEVAQKALGDLGPVQVKQLEELA